MFQIPIILMALVNLSLLGVRLWPWKEISNLPGEGSTGFDPILSLVGYVGLAFWIGTVNTEEARKRLFSSAILGLLGGLFLAAQVVLAVRTTSDEGAPPHWLQYGLIGASVLVWGICAAQTARAGFQGGFAIITAIWSAMVSCLMAGAALLGELFYSYSPGQTADPWKQYQGLAIGSESTQALVNTLLTATGFLLIGPIVAAIAGVVFSSMVKPADGAPAKK